MINAFILENLTEDEINLVLMHVAGLKRHGYGAVEIKAEGHKLIGIKDVLSENPARFKGLYASSQNKA